MVVVPDKLSGKFAGMDWVEAASEMVFNNGSVPGDVGRVLPVKWRPVTEPGLLEFGKDMAYASIEFLAARRGT